MPEEEPARVGDISEKMINLMRPTEGGREGVCCVDGSIEEARHRANGQESTHTQGYGTGVIKPPAHGSMAVTSLGGQEVTLDSATPAKKNTCAEPPPKEVTLFPDCIHHFRSYGR